MFVVGDKATYKARTFRNGVATWAIEKGTIVEIVPPGGRPKSRGWNLKDIPNRETTFMFKRDGSKGLRDGLRSGLRWLGVDRLRKEDSDVG